MSLGAAQRNNGVVPVNTVEGSARSQGDPSGSTAGQVPVAVSQSPDSQKCSRPSQGAPGCANSIETQRPVGESQTANELLRVADERMYEAKRAGRNRVVPVPPREHAPVAVCVDTPAPIGATREFQL